VIEKNSKIDIFTKNVIFFHQISKKMRIIILGGEKMKIKLLYFLKKNSQKIFLGTLFLIFILLALFFYHILFKIEEKEEIIVTEKEEMSVLKEEGEAKINYYYIDIKGEIKNPGVYLLEEGKRVVDAIKQAGGLTENADTTVNNLSRKVKDEMVIIIYSKEQVEKFKVTKEEEEKLLNEIQNEENKQENNAVLKEEEIEPSIKPNESNENKENTIASSNSKKISINKATKEEFMTLSGIGEKKAEAILAYRQEHGSFTAIEELLNVNGIGQAIFNQIKDAIEL